MKVVAYRRNFVQKGWLPPSGTRICTIFMSGRPSRGSFGIDWLEPALMPGIGG